MAELTSDRVASYTTLRDSTSSIAITGSQHAWWAFTQRTRESGLLPSMGAIGDAYDHAVIESFWGRMQTELLDRQR